MGLPWHVPALLHDAGTGRSAGQGQVVIRLLRRTQVQDRRLGVERRMEVDCPLGVHRHVLGLDRLSAVDPNHSTKYVPRLEDVGEVAALGLRRQVLDAWGFVSVTLWT